MCAFGTLNLYLTFPKRMQSETDCFDQNGFIILPPMPSGLSFKKILAPLELVFSRISK